MITLVLLPGMDGTGELFASFESALNGQFKTVVVSYPRDLALDYAGLASVVNSSCPVAEDYILLGESFSGPLAIKCASERPKGLRGVVLCTTFAKNPRPSLAMLKPFLGMLPLQIVPDYLLSAALLGRFTSAALRQSVRRAVSSVAQNVLTERLRAIAEVDVVSSAAKVDVPVLYLQASDDRLVPVRALEIIRAAIPDIQVARLDGPHCLLQASPQQAAEVVREFVQKCIIGNQLSSSLSSAPRNAP